jgi:hypothetical protein
VSGGGTSGARMYKCGSLYVISPRGALRKRYTRETKRFRASYLTVLTEDTLDLVLLAELPAQARKGSPFEIAVNLRSASSHALGELLLLDWYVARDGAWLAKRQVCQPLGVWIYGGGAVVAACLKGTEERPLRDWLHRARKEDDPRLIERLSLRVRQPSVERAERPQLGITLDSRLPVTTHYPFRDSPAERTGFDPATGPITANLSHKDRLPPSLRAACEQMDFGALRRFIDDCLRGQEASAEQDCPVTKEEFLGLLELLRDKIYTPPAKYNRRAEIVERIGRDITRAFMPDPDVPAERLPWRLLPPGELSVDRLRHHYEALQDRNPHVRYDQERIDKACSLGPERCYIGTDEFDGYVVFTFAGTDRALLECPFYGNAIYVLGPDWRRLSKMSKQELLSGRPRGVNKIVHRGNWFGRAKRALRI